MKKNKSIALITGASTGIGEKISLLLSKENFHIVLIARNIDKLKIVQEKIIEKGCPCTVIPADIRKEKSVKRISNILRNKGDVDLLINNAGLGIFNKIQNISLNEWNKQIETNLTGSFLMSRMVIPSMIKNKRGKIVFMNSVAGLNPYPYSSAYVASKYALNGFASSIREEVREHNIHVISVHPGAIDTPFWDKIKGDFPRSNMLDAESIASSVVSSVLSKDKVVHEQLIIRSVSGDIKN